MSAAPLRIVTRTQGNNRALKQGSVRPATTQLDFVEVPVLVDAFHRMVRGLEFDVCELSLTTYLCAREYGVPLTALPVFLVRGLHHGAIVIDPLHGIDHPKQLEGQRVGVNRGYTVTTSVWARGVLAEEYGVDLSSVTWVRTGEEHVAQYQPPPNVATEIGGKTVADRVASGEFAAAVGITAQDSLTPLILNPQQAGYDALRERGLYPINHLIVVRDDVLAERPELAEDLFRAFSESKRKYVDELLAGAITDPTPVDELHQQVHRITGGDPLPYGLEPNRRTVEKLIDYAMDQRILSVRPRIEGLFAHGTLDLVG